MRDRIEEADSAVLLERVRKGYHAIAESEPDAVKPIQRRLSTIEPASAGNLAAHRAVVEDFMKLPAQKTLLSIPFKTALPLSPHKND